MIYHDIHRGMERGEREGEREGESWMDGWMDGWREGGNKDNLNSQLTYIFYNFVAEIWTDKCECNPSTFLYSEEKEHILTCVLSFVLGMSAAPGEKNSWTLLIGCNLTELFTWLIKYQQVFVSVTLHFDLNPLFTLLFKFLFWSLYPFNYFIACLLGSVCLFVVLYIPNDVKHCCNVSPLDILLLHLCLFA